MFTHIKQKQYRYLTEGLTALLVVALLVVVKLVVERPMLITDRFMPGTGWIQITIAAIYAAYVINHLKRPNLTAKWRLRIWVLFSIVFFSQLFLGLIGFDKFLMTGELHFPIPALMIAGPIYRAEITFMLILFASTIVLTGPAWCSHLCYFGALDGLASKGRTPFKPIKNKWWIKAGGTIVVFGVATIMRLFAVPMIYAIILSVVIGLGGIAVMVFISRKRNKMMHCTTYCPIGTVVSFAKFVSPFRMKIDDECDSCMRCSLSCKYDALTREDIEKRRPGLTCTYCGDCITTCKTTSIHFTMFGTRSEAARLTYLILTVSMHTCCLMLARI